MNVLTNAIIILLAYLIGSIPFALVIGKGFYKTDVRKHGSGNLGATNTFRTLGKKAGIIVLIGDIAKGSLAVCLPLMMNSNLHMLVPGFIAILGHSYPVFAKFKGGKSVATAAGVFLAFSPLAFILGILAFLISLKISKYVSLSSPIGALVAFLASIYVGDVVLIVFAAIIFIFITWKHIKNFKRIKLGTEPKVNF
ncbi:glycerol-3-phosphate 1-O-acyltransferase PlsY [Priestia sp. D51]|uniref:glycerol-3-phosphate 1-O-acyltransferase PlsY n=1 Tax=Priestia aryabhattai TaxID=412384 RepID=UPI00064FE362|nr:glycerol-3-phosphate 1-O-acyltransferase PlsY [Priestia aryabhattai]KML30438.1 glycerol-3-phosphate acyltransferase [Priestia aryabhattai]KMO00032.1 glycerol-3-phosphate acyltransferase [Priestia aryabhattai]MDE8673552.1 glycerol-3-phosphate 1-O-acyltransferase PlsY [Priestia aryabhattai]